MEFNAKKCEVLKVARTRSIIDKDYYLSGTKLDRIDVKKDLGVLSWNNHVYLISSKAQIMLNLLYRTCRDITDISTKKLHYIAWVRSRLESASVVWSPHTKGNINNLNRSNAGLRDSFLVGIIRSTSASVNYIYYLCSIVEK